MRFRRRDRDESEVEPEAPTEERFFEELPPEPEVQERAPSPDGNPQGASPPTTPAEDVSPGEPGQGAEPGPDPDVDPPAVMQAESSDPPVDLLLEPIPVETPVEDREPSVPVETASDPVHAATDIDPPVMPPLPRDRSQLPAPAAEPAHAAAEPAHAAAEPVAPPETEATEPFEPEPARPTGTQDNFAERAQMAMSRLGELPQSNGVSKTRSLPRVVAIANQKGGVGKTTTTVNLGAALAELDYRVLVVDLDPQGNATSGLGIDTRNFESSMYDVIMRDAPIEDCIEPTSVQNLFVTPATIDLAGVEIELVSAFSRELKLKRAIDTVVDDFDFVLIDCPPSLGLLTINGLAAASEVLVPIQCEYYALEGLSQLLRNVQLVASNLNKGLEISAIVLTMFDARTRLAIDVANEVRSHFKDVVCRSIIPRTVRLSEAPSFGQPITVFDPSSRGAVAYRELAKEVSDGAPKRSG
jgi:chromosome partitioning protein